MERNREERVEIRGRDSESEWIEGKRERDSQRKGER